jgi:hypothetical protein
LRASDGLGSDGLGAIGASMDVCLFSNVSFCNKYGLETEEVFAKADGISRTRGPQVVKKFGRVGDGRY